MQGVITRYPAIFWVCQEEHDRGIQPGPAHAATLVNRRAVELLRDNAPFRVKVACDMDDRALCSKIPGFVWRRGLGGLLRMGILTGVSISGRG